jgi:hypothetical protein
MAVAALVISVLGIIGLLTGLRQTYLARLRQFEEKYVERYWAILDGLSLPALSLTDQVVDEDDEKVIRKYIFLCEDELQVRSAGYISDSSYREWADGMLSQFRQPMFAEIWGKAKKEWDADERRAAFPFKHLDHLLDKDDIDDGDPNKMHLPARAFRGLTVGRHRSSCLAAGLMEHALITATSAGGTGCPIP